MSKRGRRPVDVWPRPRKPRKPRRPHPLNPDIDDLIQYAAGQGPWREEPDDDFIRQRLQGVGREHIAAAYRRAYIDLMCGDLGEMPPSEIEVSQTTRDHVADTLSWQWFDGAGEREFRVAVISVEHSLLKQRLKGMSPEEAEDAKQKLATRWGHTSYKGFSKALQPSRAKRR